MMVLLLMTWLVVPWAALAHDDVPERPAITVTGHAQISLAPDTAFVTLGMETTGKTVGEAHRQNKLVMNKVVERLRALQMRMNAFRPPHFRFRHNTGRRSNASKARAGPPEIIGYIISNTITVEVRNLDKVGPAIEESLAAGANQFHGLHWALRDEQQAKLGALKQAAAKAREKASALSEALKVRLIRLLNATEESQVVHPVPKVTRSMMAMEGGGEVPVFSGEIKVEATVTLVYEIGQE